MPSKLVILCPGQGAQHVGMGKDFYDASPAAKETFDTANRQLGFDLASVCFNGPEERLNQTDVSQPAIYITSIATYRAAVEKEMISPESPAIYAGLSLGEYTALHLAGAFSFEQGLSLVACRGSFMQKAAEETSSSMVAIMGGDEATVAKLCSDNGNGEVLVPANYNAPGQIVVSGASGACKRVQQAAEAAGLRAMPLKVAGAFHSPLMQSAAQKMWYEFFSLGAVVDAPRATVYSNVTARPHESPEQIKQLLVDQITKPVKWEQTMHALLATADARFIELAPGRTLTGLAKKINRRLATDSLATVEGLSAPAAGM